MPHTCKAGDRGIAPTTVELGKEALPTLSRQARGAESAKESNAMTTITTPSSLALVPSLETAWQDVDSSFERFCLTAGIGAIKQMLCEEAQHSPARRIVVAEAASSTAGAGPKERS